MFFGISYPIAWLILAIVLVLIEAVTLQITTVWFAVGAIVAMCLALMDVAFLPQVIAFLMISSLLLYFTRPIVKRFINTNPSKTNADRLIGEEAEVLEDIYKLKASGKVKVLGQEWTAITLEDAVIPKGQIVKVLEISGVKLVVQKKQSN